MKSSSFDLGDVSCFDCRDFLLSETDPEGQVNGRTPCRSKARQLVAVRPRGCLMAPCAPMAGCVRRPTGKAACLRVRSLRRRPTSGVCATTAARGGVRFGSEEVLVWGWRKFYNIGGVFT